MPSLESALAAASTASSDADGGGGRGGGAGESAPARRGPAVSAVKAAAAQLDSAGGRGWEGEDEAEGEAAAAAAAAAEAGGAGGARLHVASEEEFLEHLEASNPGIFSEIRDSQKLSEDAEASLHNLRVASEKLPGLADDTTSTLVQARKAARTAETTLAAAIPVLAKADAATARLDALLAAVPPEQLPQLLTELQSAVRKGNVVLERVDGSTDDLQALLRKANAITRADLDRFALARGVYVRFLRPDLGDDGVLEDGSSTKRRKRRSK
jgi:hypothetical protein